MSDVTLRPRDPAYLTFIVEPQLSFGQIEINGAPLLSSLNQNQRQLVHLEEHSFNVRISIRRFAFRVSDDLVDCGIGHPLAAVYHRRREPVVDDAAVAVKLDQRRHRQPVRLRPERADIIREPLGQHRDGALGKIDGRAAL